jgi:hypothetical protein
MRFTVQMVSDGMIYMPSFIKTGSSTKVITSTI